MNILITNDDGIDSQGIYALAKEFLEEGNIIVSAPDRQRSACSHSMTMNQPIFLSESIFHNLDCRAYAVSGTPVDCVKLAFDRITNGDIDFVISGINEGGNLGTDVLYSGTVSAAIEGAVLGIPSIAVSLVHGSDRDWYSTAAHYAHMIYKKLTDKEIKKGTVFNINVPSVEHSKIKGIEATCLGNRKYNNIYEERKDSQGKTYYWLTGDIVKTENNDLTDIYAVENNYVSLTPMHFELTRFDYIDTINKWVL